MQENKILHGLDFANYINSRNIREFILLTIYKLNKIFLYLNLKNSLQKEGLSNKLEYYDYQKNLNIIKSIYNFSSLKKKINKKPCIKINNFFINPSDIDSLYSSLRIKEIIDKNIKKKNKINIVEIGAGLGKTAINLVGLMSKRIEKFFIVDLMPINIIQIYNFSNFFKKNQIWYPGSGRQIKNCKIIIVPNNMIEIINNYKFDILFNENSFPEMIPEEINKILNIFNKKGKFLFSINHETIPNKNKFVHSSLANLIKKNKINLIDRRLSWMRDGYYENLYTNR
jgi:putative sugar O-methyltransferase